MVHMLILLCLSLLVGVYGEEEKISVMEGDSVTLFTDLTDIQTDLEIEWRFENIRIARIKRSVNINPTYDGTLRDKLKMNNLTGDLTITRITSQHTGLYKLNIISGSKQNIKSFSLTVYAPLPVPVITSDVSRCSNTKCALLCSVMNVRHVTLSWYNESVIHSSVSVSEDRSISLPLEVEHQDPNTYSCVINNPVTNTTQLVCLADLCRPCSDVFYSCDTVEALMRLVVTAVIGVAALAAVIVLGYDIRSRRDEHMRKTHATPETSDD